MSSAMRKEDVTFLERAPVRHVFERAVAAPRATVFEAIADPTGWKHWFPGVRDARYRGAPPYGVGTIRESDVSGTRWVEEMITWEPGRRWAYTVLDASAPVASAQVESFELDDVPGGTRVRWTLAIEPRFIQRLAGPIAPLIMARLFERAMANLEARLTDTPPPRFGMIGIAPRFGAVDVDRWMTSLNPLVVWLLRSPLHRLLDGGLMLITVTGRRTGRRYTIPVGYQREGDVLHVLVSKARRKQWWRNFRTPASLEVEVHGERRRGQAHVVDPASARFVSVVEATLARLPMLGGQLGIEYDARRGLGSDQCATLRAEAALVEIRLDA